MYAVTDEALLAFQRDAETGELTQTASRTHSRGSAVAISDDDRYLFAFDEIGQRTSLFELAEHPDNPERLGTLSQTDVTHCRHATARLGVPAVDVFCGGPGAQGFTVQWRPSTTEIVNADKVFDTDRFGNYVPRFAIPKDLATTPDGRHVYLATHERGILIFERVGN